MTKHRPIPQVIAFLAKSEDLWLASQLLHELDFGVQRIPLGLRTTAFYNGTPLAD